MYKAPLCRSAATEALHMLAAAFRREKSGKTLRGGGRMCWVNVIAVSSSMLRHRAGVTTTLHAFAAIRSH